MDKTPLEAYMDMLMMPARIQAVMFGDWLQLGLDATPFMSGQATGRRGRGNLTLVSANNRITPSKSRAQLSLVKG